MANALPPKIMLVGFGDLGTAVLELLLREPDTGRVIVVSRNAERAERRINVARLGAIAQGFSPDVRFVAADLDDSGPFVELVEREAPDVILSTASRQTWWLADLLPGPEAARLRRARFGAWLPVHLTLTLKLMRLLREAHYAGVTLTAPFPDVVNAVLAKIDLAPDCGIGNIDEAVAKVRWMAAQRLAKPVEAVQVVMVAHHALLAGAFEGSSPLPPHYLRVEYQGKDVTGEAGGERLLGEPCPITPGPPTCFLTAGATLRFLHALSRDEHTSLHAPAPKGLPGGYPLKVRRGEITHTVIPGLSLEKAIAINEASHPFDGVERIESDGTVVFSAEDSDILRETLAYDAPKLRPDEAEARAEELLARFGEFARGLGVNLSAAARIGRLSG